MGEHYQNALRYQEEGRWRDALAELRQGAEKGDGMCCWWLCESNGCTSEILSCRLGLF